MLKEYLNNFNMYQHSNVKLKLNNKEIPRKLVDYDFIITKELNNEARAEINIYNLEINLVDTLEIYCNKNKEFSISKNEASVDNIELGLITNELSMISKITCCNKLKKLPDILNKDMKLKYKLNKHQEFKELKLQNSYIFNNTDNDLAKLQVILNKETNNKEYINAFFVENGDIYLTKPGNKEIKEHQILKVLNELTGFNNEELTLICLYNAYIMPLNKVRYKNKDSVIEREYMVISVVNEYLHNKGLIQTINLKSGNRLKLFLEK